MSQRTSRWVLRILVLLFFGPTIIFAFLDMSYLLNGLYSVFNSLCFSVLWDRGKPYAVMFAVDPVVPILGWAAETGLLVYFMWRHRRPPRHRAKTARRRSR